MKTYLVGGAVRDMLLGIKPQDRDWVVTGSSPEEMKALGYQQVGGSFPVFLHPQTGEEYALARTERKTGAGYHAFKMDFNPTVTLEEDLSRRDLTMNSMALDTEAFQLIDPYGGRHDLFAGILRHTSEAFAEDPVRVLRTARFGARYGFKIDIATLALMQKVTPEIATVSQERVWKEFEKGLMEPNPLLMIRALSVVGALDLPCMEVYRYANPDLMNAIHPSMTLMTRLATVIQGDMRDGPYMIKLMEKAKMPSDLIKVLGTWMKEKHNLFNYSTLKVDERISLFDRVRAFSDIDLLNDLCAIMDQVMVPYMTNFQGQHKSDQTNVISRDLSILWSIDAAAIAASVEPKSIKQAIFAARVSKLAAYLK